MNKELNKNPAWSVDKFKPSSISLNIKLLTFYKDPQSPRAAMMLLYMALRNLVTQTATTKAIANDAGTVVVKKTVSDDGTTYTETEMVGGP